MTDDPNNPAPATEPQQTAAIPVVPPAAMTGQGGNAADVPIPPSPSQESGAAPAPADPAPSNEPMGAPLTMDEIEVPRRPAASLQELAQAPLVHDNWRDQMFTPGKVDLDHGSDAPIERPAWSSTLSAEFQKNNMIGSLISSDAMKTSTYVQPGYNPWEDIKGTPYEDHWDRFAGSTNSGFTAALKRDIDRENANNKTLSLAPWWQTVPFGMAAGVADPTILLPGGAFVKGARGGIAIGRTALSVGAAAGAASAVQEAGLQATQQTRTTEESVENVGASVLLGAALGAGGAAVLSRGEWKGAVEAIDRDIARASPVAGDVGAAAAPMPKIDDLTIAGRAAGAVAGATENLNPSLRLLQSESPVVRDVGSQLFENSLYMRQNMGGIASPVATETAMKEYHGGLGAAIKGERDIWKAYRKNGGELPLPDFQEQVGRAMRRGDESDIPEVAQAAKQYRAAVFDPPKEQAIELGLLPQDVSVGTAQSYFSRIWNRNRMNAEEGRFKDIVTDHYDGAMKNDFVEGAQSLKQRLARLDQERADLGLPTDARDAALGQIDARLEQLYGSGFNEADEKLTDLRRTIRKAREAGDDAAAQAAKAESERVLAQGGDDLKNYLAETAQLRSRRQTVSMNTAGLAERSERIMEKLADIEEDNHRTMQRLIRRGQISQPQLARLEPKRLADHVSKLRDSFASLASKADAAADRAKAGIEALRAKAERAAGKASRDAEKAAADAAHGDPEKAAAARASAREARDKATAVTAERDAKIEARLKKAEAAVRNRSERMTKVAKRLEIAEDFDREGALAEIEHANERLAAEASNVSLTRGERAQRMWERLAELDPQRVEARLKTIDRMRRETERRFYDRWEINRQGQKLDLDNPHTANFRDMASDIANHIFDTLSGRGHDPGGTNPDVMKVNIRGPMKDRTFNIPDEMIEDFLEHNSEMVARRYTRSMGADIELTRKFGSPDMASAFQRVKDDYARLRAGVTDEKALLKLAKAEKDDTTDLAAVRDLLRGTLQPPGYEKSLGKIIRTVNNINYLRKMGKVVVASLGDAVRPAMVHGLGQFITDVPQLVTNLRGIRMSVKEAQLAGNVLERVLSHKMATLTEMTDPYATRGPIEAFTHNMTEVMNKANGIRMWTDGMKSMAAVMTQNRILKNVERGVASIKARERAYMAYLGIDESMAQRIAKEFAEHGEQIQGVRVANTENWTDAVARRTYRAAMNKDIDSIIVQPGVADVPLWAHTASGKMMLQFKTFTLASHQRVFMRGLQEGNARFVGGMVALTFMGMMTRYLQALSTNNQKALDDYSKKPGTLIGEGLDAGGGLPLLLELSNTFEQFSTVNPVKAGLQGALDPKGFEPIRAPDTSKLLTGPAGGLFNDLGMAGYGAAQAMRGQTVSRRSKKAALTLMPFTSVFGVQEVINHLLLDPPQRR